MAASYPFTQYLVVRALTQKLLPYLQPPGDVRIAVRLPLQPRVKNQQIRAMRIHPVGRAILQVRRPERSVVPFQTPVRQEVMLLRGVDAGEEVKVRRLPTVILRKQADCEGRRRGRAHANQAFPRRFRIDSSRNEDVSRAHAEPASVKIEHRSHSQQRRQTQRTLQVVPGFDVGLSQR